MNHNDYFDLAEICNAWINEEWSELPVLDNRSSDEYQLLTVLSNLRQKMILQQSNEIALRSSLAELASQQHDSFVLCEAGKLLTSTLNIKDLLHEIMNKIKEIFSLADGVAVFLYDQGTNLFNGVATYGFPGYDNAPWGTDMGAPGIVFSSKQPLLADTPEQVAYLYSTMYGLPKELLESMDKTRPPLQSILCTPFIARDRAIGVIQLMHWKDQQVFKQRDLNLILQLADLIAIAIDNGLLWEELEKKEERLQGMLTQLINAQEAERKRIARRLHDDTSQDLSTVAIGLAGLANTLPEENNDIKKKIRQQIDIIKNINNKMRDLTYEIRPAVLDDLGLTAALKWYASSLSGELNPSFLLNLENIDQNLDPTISTVLFRISQEAIRNALKYSQAREIRIDLMKRNDSISLTIQDNGVGFDYQRIIKNHPASFGLHGMKERIGLVNGSLTITSSHESGTKVQIHVPLKYHD